LLVTESPSWKSEFPTQVNPVSLPAFMITAEPMLKLWNGLNTKAPKGVTMPSESRTSMVARLRGSER
jgi:hypothetical protein